MFTFKFLSLVASTIGVSFVANANSTVKFWHTMNTEETKTLEQIVANFQKANPTIKVDMQAIPFDGADIKIKTSAQAGDAADIIRADIGWVASFADMGILEDLGSYLSQKDKDDYIKGPLNTGMYKSKLYAIPQVTDCLALMYNKSMFKAAGVQPPKTMDDLLALGKKLSKPEAGVYALTENVADAYWFFPFVWAFGGDLVSSDRKVKINSPEAIKALEFIIKLAKEKVMTDKYDFPNNYANMMAAFKDGKAAMLINGPWSTSDVLGGSAFKDSSNLGITLIPKAVKYGSPIGGHDYVMYKGAKNKTDAYKFMNFINSAESQALLAKNNNLFPTRLSAYNHPDVKNNPIISQFKPQLEVANSRPVIPEMQQLFDPLKTELQAALLGQKTPKAALDSVATEWNKILKNK